MKRREDPQNTKSNFHSFTEKKVAIIPPWEQQCQDIADECATDDWKENCESHKEFMAKNCAKTCDFCSKLLWLSIYKPNSNFTSH